MAGEDVRDERGGRLIAAALEWFDALEGSRSNGWPVGVEDRDLDSMEWKEYIARANVARDRFHRAYVALEEVCKEYREEDAPIPHRFQVGDRVRLSRARYPFPVGPSGVVTAKNAVGSLYRVGWEGEEPRRSVHQQDWYQEVDLERAR